MKMWVLDVKAGEYGATVTYVGEDGSLSRKDYPLKYSAYLKPRGVDAEWLAGKVWEHPGIEDVAVEAWRAPPWYEASVQVVKVTSGSLRYVRDVVKRAERLGWGLEVNEYPHPLVKALREARLNPCGTAGSKEWEDPLVGEPPYRVIEVEADSLRRSLRIVSPSIKATLTKEGVKEVSAVFREAHVLLLGEGVRLRDLPREAAEVPVVTKVNPLVGIHGLIEWCRISWIPLRLLGNASIGEVLTTVEAFEALKRKYLILGRLGRAEPFRPARKLIVADRGGVIITPPGGVHFNVAQLDFNSLYPSIIWKFNVSPETVGRPNCSRKFRVPELEREICTDLEGVVPATLKALIARREVLREASRNPKLPPSAREVLDERQKALKWVLVASFGYLGYRNSRFGKIEAYECVTALARQVLKEAVKVAESSGFKVLHAIVDSLFVSRLGASDEDYIRLADRVSEEVGIRVKVEGVYDWIAFPSTAEGIPSPMKYFGRLKDGSLVVKGLKAVKSSEPPIVREAQLKALHALVRGRDLSGLRNAFPEAVKTMKSYLSKVMKGEVTLEELTIRKRLRRAEYRSKQPHVRAAKAAGVKGGVVEYIIASIPYPAGMGMGYSTSRYVKALLRAWEEIAEPLKGVIYPRNSLNVEGDFEKFLSPSKPNLPQPYPTDVLR